MQNLSKWRRYLSLGLKIFSWMWYKYLLQFITLFIVSYLYYLINVYITVLVFYKTNNSKLKITFVLLAISAL